MNNTAAFALACIGLGALIGGLTVLLATADAIKDAAAWGSKMDQILDADAEAEAMRGSNP